jgi:hypothetical protein
MKKFFQIGIAAAIGIGAGLLLPDVAWAAGIEAGCKRIYSVVVDVGKWIIIVKGTIDCIQSVLQGDFQAAKHQFFGYLMCFGIMLALPWGLNEIEAVFKQ